MIFWTIVFIALHFILLVKGNVLRDTTIRNGELEIKTATEGVQTKVQLEMLKNLAPTLLLIPIVIIELIYLFTATDNDFFKFPTLIMIAMNIIGFVRFKKTSNQKRDLSTEEKRNEYRKELYSTKRRSLKSTLINLVDVIYYVYMLYCLVFLGM
ncbi:UNVERIFIED_CONTAM: hypothetical protein ABIC26_002607 [Paenibacillus sp. PvR008]